MGHLRSKMPYLWGKEAAQTRLIDQLEEIFVEVRRRYQVGVIVIELDKIRLFIYSPWTKSGLLTFANNVFSFYGLSYSMT
jgi:hypothetical protein